MVIFFKFSSRFPPFSAPHAKILKILEGHAANFVHIKNEKSIFSGVKKFRFNRNWRTVTGT